LDGTYETTLAAIKHTQNIPVVALHDFQRANCSGVEDAVKDYGREIIGRADSTIILANK
jgi:hypothetical protein